MKIIIFGMASRSIAYGFSGKLLVSLRNPPPLSRQNDKKLPGGLSEETGKI
jgi:hypothetical protein